MLLPYLLQRLNPALMRQASPHGSLFPIDYLTVTSMALVSGREAGCRKMRSKQNRRTSILPTTSGGDEGEKTTCGMNDCKRNVRLARATSCVRKAEPGNGCVTLEYRWAAYGDISLHYR